VKRAVLVLVCALAAVSGVLGLVVGLPLLRRASEIYRHIRLAASKEPEAREAWTRELGDPDKTLMAFPKQRDNATALRLVQLVRPLGVDIARPQPEQRRLIEAAGDRALNGALADYVRSELTKDGGSIEPPRETVRALLETCRLEIDAIAGFLSTSEPILWESDVSLGPEAPVPNLLGQLQLQRVFIAEALNRARLGRPLEAEEIFEASWALNATLRNRPDVQSQLFAIAAARMEVGLVRRIGVEPASWHERLADHDYRATLLQALEVESIGLFRHLPAGKSLWDRASRSDFLSLRRAFLVTMRDSAVSDGSIEDLIPREEREPTPESLGVILESISTPNLAMAIRRVDRLIVDTELSEHVLEARHLRGKLGHWPKTLAGTGASRLRGGHWDYSADRDDRMTISFSRDLHWGEQKGIVLPIRYSSR
jgi:hypothetical protein